MSRGTIGRAVGVGMGLLVALAAPAQGAQRGDVISFPKKYPLAKAERFVVKGSPVALDGSPVAAKTRTEGRHKCRFPAGSLSLAPGERAVELRQVSINTRTCRTVYERGVPPKWVMAEAAIRRKGEGATGASQRGQGASDMGAKGARVGARALLPPAYQSTGSRGNQPGYRYHGYVNTFWEDPIGIDVNNVWDGADWDVSPRYPNCIGRNHTWQSYRWYARTGWGEPVRNSSWANNRCAYVMSSSYARFGNGAFCAGGDVFCTYNRTRFYGYPDGRMRASWHSFTTGAFCKDFLSFDKRMGRFFRAR